MSNEDTSPQRISNQPARLSQLLPAADVMPWMKIARGEIGTREVPGTGNSSRVLEYLRSVGNKRAWFLQDATPWCASYLGWCLLSAGIVPTFSAAARSYLTWGDATEMRIGAVCVLKRGLPWQAHVGFITDWDDKTVSLLSGNHNNAVNIAKYPIGRVLGCRWPSPKAPA